MKAIYCTNSGDSYHPISYHSIVDSYHSRVTLILIALELLNTFLIIIGIWYLDSWFHTALLNV